MMMMMSVLQMIRVIFPFLILSFRSFLPSIISWWYQLTKSQFRSPNMMNLCQQENYELHLMSSYTLVIVAFGNILENDREGDRNCHNDPRDHQNILWRHQKLSRVALHLTIETRNGIIMGDIVMMMRVLNGWRHHRTEYDTDTSLIMRVFKGYCNAWMWVSIWRNDGMTSCDIKKQNTLDKSILQSLGTIIIRL